MDEKSKLSKNMILKKLNIKEDQKIISFSKKNRNYMNNLEKIILFEIEKNWQLCSLESSDIYTIFEIKKICN